MTETPNVTISQGIMYQLILRQFLDNRQYEHTVRLYWKPENQTESPYDVIEGEKDVIKWLSKVNNSPDVYVIILQQTYIYKDIIFDDEKVDTVLIEVTKQSRMQAYEISTHDWLRDEEIINFKCSNKKFQQYIDLGFYLNSPNLQDYIGLDILRYDNGLIVENTATCDINAYKYFKLCDLLTDVRVSHLLNFNEITNGHIATIKYDGIHHIVSTYKGESIAFVKPDFVDRGFFIDIGENATESAILSTELMEGTFYVLDIYAYIDDMHIYSKTYSERLDYIRRLNLPDDLFTVTDFIEGEIMTGANIEALKALFEKYPSVNDLISVRTSIQTPNQIKFYNYVNEISKLKNDESSLAQKYYNDMKDYLLPSDRGMQLATKYNINEAWVYILSPAIIESLIVAFYQFGIIPEYWNNIVEYVCTITNKSADNLKSLRYAVIEKWNQITANNYSSDGIVFYRNGPLFNARKPQILKWKPSNLLTVDTIIVLDENRNVQENDYLQMNIGTDIPVVPCKLYCRRWDDNQQDYVIMEYLDNYRNITNFKVKLDSFTRSRPKCKNGNIVIPGKSITEILINEDGLIEPYRVRYDKVSPNSCTLLDSVYNNKQPVEL